MSSTFPSESSDAEAQSLPPPRDPVGGESTLREPAKRAPRPRTPAEQVAFLSRLAGGLAHEIKNPLSTMAINLALLEEEWMRVSNARNAKEPELTPREQRSLRRVKTLQREVQRLEHIVQEFLIYAKGGEINRAPRDLASLLRDLLEFVEPEDAGQGIRHHVDLAVGLPLVLIDASAIQQALLNLLVNARQAMPGGGELLVRLRRDGNWVECSVTDTGIGMRPDQLARCFDEYWSDKKGGTGLGLSTARRIIEEHGGSIDVVSEPGRGTSFTVYLPLFVELTGERPPRSARRT
ncbi:MAG TPA: ATP-binding protein, partial [Planctomycetota bacterium]|nr:ATP-binding protein [Planctomycetota bacterium]